MKQKQVTNVSYFQDKKRRMVKAVTTWVEGKPCVQFIVFKPENGRRWN